MLLNHRHGALLLAIALTLALAFPSLARRYNYTAQERILLTRDLAAEYATAKITLPRSKKPLPVDSDGEIDTSFWSDAHADYGPAARMGDIIQITNVKFEKNRLVLQVNGGFKGGRKWYERIQIGGMGGGMRSVGGGATAQTIGTVIALVFPGGVPELDAASIKEILNQVLDFEKRSATEQYVESLPEPVQAAIKENRAIEGMDVDSVLLSMGKPVRKVRETKDGVQTEDWVYGEPPGKITFVTFQGTKVIRVKETYAGLGGTTAPPLPAH